MAFYISLTTFRVLTLVFAIVSLDAFVSIPLFGLLLLGIIIIGYKKTTKEGDFIVRGLRSLVTTGKLNLNCLFYINTESEWGFNNKHFNNKMKPICTLHFQWMCATTTKGSSKSTGWWPIFFLWRSSRASFKSKRTHSTLGQQTQYQEFWARLGDTATTSYSHAATDQESQPNKKKALRFWTMSWMHKTTFSRVNFLMKVLEHEGE